MPQERAVKGRGGAATWGTGLLMGRLIIGLPGVFGLGFFHELLAVGGEVLGVAWVVGIAEGDVDVALGETGDLIDLIDEMKESILEIPFRWNFHDTIIGEEEVLLGVVILEVDGLQNVGTD